MFLGVKRIVSSLETIFETNRYRRREGEGAAIHLQTPCLSAIQKKSEGAGRIEHVIEKSIELFKTHME